MEEDDAMAYIKQFSKLASSKRNEFQVSVNQLLVEDLQAKSKKLLDEYVKKLVAISEEFNSGGLSINLSSFVQGKLVSLNADSVIDASIDTRIEKYTETQTKTVTKRRTGWDRLFHLSSWFHPEYEDTESYDVEIEEEISFVSREKLTNQLVAPIRKLLITERNSHANLCLQPKFAGT